MPSCPFTGLMAQAEPSINPLIITYKLKKLGKVSYVNTAYHAIKDLPIERKVILQGIILNQFINGEEPTVITNQYLSNFEVIADYPKSFEEKARHLLKYFYTNGGKESRTFNMNSSNDSPLIYSTSEEFDRVIRHLKMKDYIDFDKVTPTNPTRIYQGIHLTLAGIEEYEKGLPQQPMSGLVSQDISTGDTDADRNINHARKQFFDKHATMESKRSACEILAFVLEPLREEIKTVLLSKDVEAFFIIVNTFDIRHNRVHLKTLEHEEQLEWVFYSLLNTINTYSKLKSKK